MKCFSPRGAPLLSTVSTSWPVNRDANSADAAYVATRPARHFEPGNEPILLNLKDVNIAITICADIWDIEWMTDLLKDQGKIQMIANLSASPFYLGKIEKKKITGTDLSHHSKAIRHWYTKKSR